ncbi:glycyl radical protein [Clostridium sp. 'deep sea']|uniref:trans-4-hydroxy-L-proline dehydratase n=1 Tax=Clostridium sp. 'deep sea' TaxID=2779445 RepID=UPI00189688D8|nr:trans-4-hydroxy-L-proline dehydratase [Clostridium sp. 'deep sea']QOR34748.1 glycyl radical protein [Clostridium sp. 'deep sea']
MNDRVKKLRQQSYNAKPTICAERAALMTDFYVKNDGKYPIPVMRAMAYYYLCDNKTIYIGEDELIVGERGSSPKAVSTYPELTCHSIEDLKILNNRDKTPYIVTNKVIKIYKDKVIPYWRGRSMRDKLFVDLSQSWQDCYAAGMFTEFMEQRAPGHTAMDGKIYNKGLIDFKKDIKQSIANLDFYDDPQATKKLHQLKAMHISCDATIRFAQRHAELAKRMAENEENEERKQELLRIAEVCSHVPANAPRNLWEALQMYWFIHLGCITELNGWDAFSPGHLDQHLYPFYNNELQANSLTRDQAKELIECFFIKFNNHPAPPKVGVTAQESGTYNDFTNINIGGINKDGRDGVNEVSFLLLEVIEDIHLLQPGTNIQVSRHNSDFFIKAACRVIRNGYGYPSVFNADTVVEEMVRMGKSIEDARTGGVSGCVETGCFGKEAYVLTGYLNIPKVLELTLNNGYDPQSKKQLGIKTGELSSFKSYAEFFEAFKKQLHHIVEIKVRGNQYIEQMFATLYPATFMSVIMDDCIKKGKDYNDGGPRYNTTFIQGVGIGSITDSLSAIKTHVFDNKTIDLPKLTALLHNNFANNEPIRQMLLNRTPKYGNDNAYADDIMRDVFEAFYQEVEGRLNTKGGEYHIDMLPTTCHIYFGSVIGALPDGRLAGKPLSEGISPVQGADRNGPTAVIKSAGKMDHVRTGGTLLNMSLMPAIVKDEEGINKLTKLIRSYFRMGAHHIQFNVVDKEILIEAQKHPEQYRDLLVRVAGYSDYFVDLGTDLQNEIITRTSINHI